MSKPVLIGLRRFPDKCRVKEGNHIFNAHYASSEGKVTYRALNPLALPRDEEAIHKVACLYFKVEPNTVEACFV